MLVSHCVSPAAEIEKAVSAGDTSQPQAKKLLTFIRTARAQVEAARSGSDVKAKEKELDDHYKEWTASQSVADDDLAI